MFSYDHELERTLCNMNTNLGIHDDDPNQNIPTPVDVHGQLLPDAPVGTSRGDRTPVHVLKNTTETLTI